MARPSGHEGGDDAEPSRPATIYDVARVAGVSHQLVARYLRGEGVRPANRDKVIAALAVMDYRPNMTARSLATSSSHRIAVLTQEIGQVGPALIAQGASAEARANGYLLDIIALDVTDADAIGATLRELNQEELAGVLVLASTDEMVEAFERASFRVPAFFGAEHDEASGATSPQFSSVAFEELIDKLYALGHRDFFHLAGPRTWAAARNRERAYHQALVGHGLQSVGTAYGDWSPASGYAAARFVPPEATAVVVANDQMAIGVMRGLAELGRSVPEDVSVTGVDDIPEAEYVSPPLTTVSIDFVEQGRASFRRLLAQIRGASLDEPIQSAHVVMRQSTGRR